mmetsp:Transcript_24520/g.58300  ORF Transcript_24520/g.58300 Transcript_24520/m.58300 type:complete len:254 (+) Transcript_24520:260-1021(+)
MIWQSSPRTTYCWIRYVSSNPRSDTSLRAPAVPPRKFPIWPSSPSLDPSRSYPSAVSLHCGLTMSTSLGPALLQICATESMTSVLGCTNALTSSLAWLYCAIHRLIPSTPDSSSLCSWSWGAASLRRRRRLRVSGDAMLKSCMMPPGQSSSVAMSAPSRGISKRIFWRVFPSLKAARIDLEHSSNISVSVTGTIGGLTLSTFCSSSKELSAHIRTLILLERKVLMLFLFRRAGVSVRSEERTFNAEHAGTTNA